MAFFTVRPMTIRRPRYFDPFEEFYGTLLMACQRQQQLPFEEFYGTPEMARQQQLIPHAIPDSIKNENGKFEIKCAVPGFSPENMKLDLDGNKLILSGIRESEFSFEKVERIFGIPDGVDLNAIKCEFDPATNQLCIAAPSTTASESVPKIDSGKVAAPESVTMETPIPESEVQQESESAAPIPQQDSEVKSQEAIKGKDYIERETDEGIEIDTTVSEA